jgi:hypothetical protein
VTAPLHSPIHAQSQPNRFVAEDTQMTQQLNSDHMSYASFPTMKDAASHRSIYGGWIFAVEGGSEFIWFDISFTPTPIINHRATRGLSGCLY